MSDSALPFHETPGNPVPDGLLSGLLPAGRHALRFAILPARGATPRGTVVLLQGRNEAVEKYFETMADLAGRGFTVASFDWRGQGGSGRLSPFRTVGHVGRLRTLTDDLVLFVEAVVRVQCPGPIAMVAHSMGGLVALAATERLDPTVERLVCLAPLVDFAGPPPVRRLLARAAGLLHWIGLGHLPLRRARTVGPQSTLEGNALTSDARRFERNRALREAEPDLFVRSLSASWIRAVSRAMRRLDRSPVIARMRLPTLIVTAGADRVVDSGAAARLAWRMRSGHHITVPGARHELLQETDRFREPVLEAIDAFLAGALPATAAEAAPEPLPPIDTRPIEAALGEIEAYPPVSR